MKGEVFPAETSTFTDPVTGVAVRQLTHYKAHSHHLYFTNPGWYDDGRRLLFASDRANRTNLFSLDLASYEITQLTDLDPLPPPTEVQFIDACVNPQRAEAYFWYGRALMALDLHTRELARLWERPAGFTHSMLNCTADGRHICVCVYEGLPTQFAVDLLRGYVGFEETWVAHPLSRILRVAVDSGDAEIVWEEQNWIGHVNTSPTQPHLLTFCHEGPWDKVDQRIWGHNSSMHIQQLHVHSRFTPEGSGVLFTSDRSGYGALYLADVVDFARLPALRTAPA